MDQLHQSIQTTLNKLCTSELFIRQLYTAIFANISKRLNEKFNSWIEEKKNLEEKILKQNDVIDTIVKRQEKYKQFHRRDQCFTFWYE